jgi:hypothetical protein
VGRGGLRMEKNGNKWKKNEKQNKVIPIFRLARLIAAASFENLSDHLVTVK